MNDPKRRIRRCKCHKLPITVEKDDAGNVVKRICVYTGEEIELYQTYVATMGSDQELPVDQGPPVQRGMFLND